MELGKRIRNLRKLKNLSTKELGENIGISQQYISDIENGRATPSLKILEKLAEYFSVTIDFLRGSTDNDGGYLRLLFAAKLREKRKKDKLSLSDISEALGFGIDNEHLAKVENAEFCDDWFWEYAVLGKYIGLGEDLGERLVLYSTTAEKLQDIITRSSNDPMISFVEDEPSTYNAGYFGQISEPIYFPIFNSITKAQNLFDKTNIVGFFPTDKQFLSPGKEYFCLQIKGDSMNYDFRDGSLVLVQKQNYLDSGDIGVILINGTDIVVRKTFIKDKIITLIPQSIDRQYQPEFFDMSKGQVKILGKVILSLNKH